MRSLPYYQDKIIEYPKLIVFWKFIQEARMQETCVAEDEYAIGGWLICGSRLCIRDGLTTSD